jgi:hypothetical protein
MAETRKFQFSRGRLLPLLALVVPFAVALGLAINTGSHGYLSSSTTTWVAQNRASTQIIVQILSTLLGACQIYALQTLIRFWISTRLTKRSTSLDTLKSLDAIRAARFDLDVPAKWAAFILFSLVVIHFPSAIWAGALTPVFATADSTGSLLVPGYSDATQTLWGSPCLPGVDCGPNIQGNGTQLGTFTYVAWKSECKSQAYSEVQEVIRLRGVYIITNVRILPAPHCNIR